MTAPQGERAGFRGVSRTRIILAVLLSLSSTSCTDADAATGTLLDAGYTEVKVEGWDVWACGEGDWSSTKFVALNPTGTRNVRGVVCCGLFLKSCTIRH